MTTLTEQQQMLTFKVGEYHFAISVEDVREVVEEQQVTPVPLSPKRVKGILNLRGEVLTALGMRSILNIKQGQEGFDHIVIQKNGILCSLIVDSVTSVVDTQQVNFELTPDTIDENIKKFIDGIYKMDDLLIKLNLDKILRQETV